MEQIARGYSATHIASRRGQSAAADPLLLDTGEAIGHVEKTIGRVLRRKRRHGTTRLVAIEYGVLGIPEET